jgi:hypothetical protein
MAEEWEFFFCRVNDAPASIFVDLGLREAAPQRERPHLLWVWVSMLNPREDGLSRSDEAPQLHEIDQRLGATLAEQLDAVHVGRITTSGRREFYYYAPAPVGFDEAVSDTMSRFPQYAYDCGEQEDARWSQYLEVLYPGPRDLQWIRDRQVVERLQELGDLLHAPREVEHYLYFPSEQSRQAVVDQVRRAGFTIRDMSVVDGAAGRLNRFGLRICRSDPVDLDSIHAVVADLLDRATAVGGEYDGWETPVVREVPRKGVWNRWPWSRK